ncbi:alpha/beta hydrolase [Arthrobacter sp. ISL-48]|uniref:alpha/beta fold hydrolase n=1 Tax=Arthrobacter sp. ISL-48 TaxID=2819110 RepID=UPI001BE92356|nr:alpha/beta hydrolase [Arthrobacter sp. ISL-48]MBT2533046.1 alpha/beta hydrolase [Arthrobacter sp. ISL-48]
MDSVEVAGLRIAYQRAGQGPPLVLLHGAYEDSRIWWRQLDGLSDDFSVIAWDAPGCGQSDDPPPELTGPDFGDALARFLRAVVSEKPHVLGLSWGSCVALELYKGHPQAAASLVLASAYAGWAGSLPPREVERRIAQISAELGQPAEAFVQDWLPTLFTERAGPALLEEAAAIIADFHPAGMRAMLNAMGRSDYRDVLPVITVPTLLLYGAEDVRAPLDVARDMHRNIRGSELVVLPDVGHLAPCEAPEAFNAAVRRFLHAHPA